MTDHLETLITKEAALRGLRLNNLFCLQNGEWQVNFHDIATRAPAGLGFYRGASPTEAVEKALRDLAPPASAASPPEAPVEELFE